MGFHKTGRSPILGQPQGYDDLQQAKKAIEGQKTEMGGGNCTCNQGKFSAPCPVHPHA